MGLLFVLWAALTIASPAIGLFVAGFVLLIIFPETMIVICGVIVAAVIAVWVLVQIWREIKALYG